MRTIITAHSGCEGTPDNTLEYVRYALTCGADALEVDIRFWNGDFCISHNPPEESCPKLEEVFELVGKSSMLLNCDLKEPGLEREVLALARPYGIAQRLVLSGTVSAEAAADPEIQRQVFWNVENALPCFWEQYKAGIPFTEEAARKAAEAFQRQGAKVINIHYGFCTPENLKIFQEYGIGVSAWTVNDEAQARRLLRAGVYNITSRKPQMVLALREGKTP